MRLWRSAIDKEKEMFYEGSKDYSLNTILNALRASSYTFALTGSRYFGTSHATSDWDYFVDGGEEGIEAWLHRVGFEEQGIFVASYGDCTTKTVYRWLPSTGYQWVDVQILKFGCFKQKMFAQEILCDYPFPIIKQDHRTTDLWNWAASLHNRYVEK